MLTTEEVKIFLQGYTRSRVHCRQLKERIEALGGKVTGSVSKNTDYLINNDNQSNSTKN